MIFEDPTKTNSLVSTLRFLYPQFLIVKYFMFFPKLFKQSWYFLSLKRSPQFLGYGSQIELLLFFDCYYKINKIILRWIWGRMNTCRCMAESLCCPPGTRWCSVQFSRSVTSNSLQPHGLQHARLPCPSPLPEPTQTHVHCIGDATQPSHPLSSPSPPTFNLSQHHGPFQWVRSSHQVGKVLEFQLQHHSFQWIFRTSFL